MHRTTLAAVPGALAAVWVLLALYHLARGDDGNALLNGCLAVLFGPWGVVRIANRTVVSPRGLWVRRGRTVHDLAWEDVAQIEEGGRWDTDQRIWVRTRTGERVRLEVERALREDLVAYAREHAWQEGQAVAEDPESVAGTHRPRWRWLYPLLALAWSYILIAQILDTDRSWFAVGMYALLVATHGALAVVMWPAHTVIGPDGVHVRREGRVHDLGWDDIAAIGDASRWKGGAQVRVTTTDHQDVLLDLHERHREAVRAYARSHGWGGRDR